MSAKHEHVSEPQEYVSKSNKSWPGSHLGAYTVWVNHDQDSNGLANHE